MKKILLSFALFAVAGAAYVGIKASTTNHESSLMLQNIEAMAMQELPTGYEQGRTMRTTQILNTSTISGEGHIGTGGIGGSVGGENEYVWVSCCLKATSNDACNRSGEDPRCKNHFS